jgi:hypothetical protein
MRKVILGLLAISVVGFGIGYVLTNSTVFKLCMDEEYQCRELYNTIGDPLYFGMGALAFVFVVLSIFPTAFNAWKNFALWFLPLATDIFVTYKGPGGGFMDPLPGPVEMYRWLGGLYIVLSLAIIVGSLLCRQFGKNKPPKMHSRERQIIFWSLWTLYIVIIIGAHFFD